MTDSLDDDQLEPMVYEVVKESEPETKKDIIVPPKANITTSEKIFALVPKSVDEAWRMADAFVMARMVPDSLKGNTDKETQAKVMAVILKGLEVGFGPATAIQTIMVINQKPCIYGDGTVALLQRSNKIEYIKTEAKGTWGDITKDFVVTVTLKRKDQSEPYIRSFGYKDAKTAGLVGKRGPWVNYPERQCYWRALSWAARDGAGDALMGLQVAEEVQDYITDRKREEKTDTSSLD